MKEHLLTVLFLLLTSVSQAENKLLSIEDAFRDPSVLWIKMSPDAKHILLVLNGDKQKTLTLVNVEKREQTHLYKLEDNQIQDIEWIDNDTVFLEVDVKEMDETVNALIDIPSEMRKKPETRVIKTKGYIVNTLPEIDNKLLFAKSDGGGFDLYQISPADLVAGNFDGDVALENTLEGIARYFYDEHNDQYMAYTFENDKLQCHILDKDSQKWNRIWESDSPADTFIPLGLVDNKTLAVLSNVDSERTALRLYNIEKKAFTETLFEHPRYDLTSAYFDAKTRKPVFVTYRDHGQLAMHYFSSRDIALERKLKNTFNGKQVRVVSESSNGDSKLIFATASDDPGQYYFLNTRTLKAGQLYARFDHLSKHSFNKTESFEVESRGEKIEAILTTPTNYENGVLLVMPHGGPIDVRDADDFNLTNQYFSSRGYTVLNVNFRGSSGYGRRFTEAGRGEFGKAIENDINAAVDAVLTRRKIKQICAIGASYGGYSAAMLAIQNPERYQCAVSLFGVFDLPLLFNASNLATRPAHQKAVRYVVGDNTPALKTISPVYLADKLRVPILLIAGKLDSIATFEQSNRFEYQLKKYGKRVDSLHFDDVGHGHHQWLPERVQYAYINSFLQETLKLPLVAGKSLQVDELMLIADAFYFDDNVANDSEKALSYYRRAAELGDARAMYNVGSFYHRGDVVAKDLQQAIAWYKKAAEKDYADANHRLGLLLLDRNAGAIDAEQSFTYLKRASELGKRAATLEMAKRYATGTGVAKDFQKAMEILRARDSIYYEKELCQKILAEIAWERSLSEADILMLKDAISLWYDNPSFETALASESYGIYHSANVYSNKDRDYVNRYIRDEKNTSIPVRNGVQFGALLEFGGKGKKGERLAIKYYWHTPASVTNDNRIHENGAFFDIVDVDTEIPFIYKLETEKELIAGDWQLEVRTFDNKLLYIKDFKTVDPVSKPVESMVAN